MIEFTLASEAWALQAGGWGLAHSSPKVVPIYLEVGGTLF